MACLLLSSTGMASIIRQSTTFIYMATIDGLVIIYSDNETSPSADSHVKLSSLAIGGNIIYPSSGDYLQKGISPLPPVFSCMKGRIVSP